MAEREKAMNRGKMKIGHINPEGGPNEWRYPDFTSILSSGSHVQMNFFLQNVTTYFTEILPKPFVS